MDPDDVDGLESTDRNQKYIGYPSRGSRSHMPHRPTNDSIIDGRRLNREGTSDERPPKTSQRLRYTIPLRHTRTPAKDEEKGFVDEKSESIGQTVRIDVVSDGYKGSPKAQPQDFLEVISTQFTIPDDEGREIVTLTYKDASLKADAGQVSCESRWRHIESDAMTFSQFENQVIKVPGLENDDLALVARLLRKVQKTCEKQFVHGRFLRPITVVYEGRDPDDESSDLKTATFLSMPVFTIESPRRLTSTREFEGHPKRALLQSRYRLETMRKRDKEQIITKVHPDKGHVVHVPQIWALIINKYTIITCAPMDRAMLCGETIKLMSYADARRDEATWSVQFTDSRGSAFYLPLRLCRTWFSLVWHITEECLVDEYSLIRDQLLKNGPLYKLVSAKMDTPVSAESWPKMVEEKKTEVIQLRLIDNTGSSKQLVTYYDDQGNEMVPDLDTHTDTSSSTSEDNLSSVMSDSSSASSLASPNSTIEPAIEKLRHLQDRLQKARDRGNGETVQKLQDYQIPLLEEKILKWTAESMGMHQPRKESTKRKARVALPKVYRARGSSHRSEESASSDSADTDNHVPPSMLRPSSRRGSQARSYGRNRSLFSSARDFATDGQEYVEPQSSGWSSWDPDKNNSLSQSRHDDNPRSVPTRHDSYFSSRHSPPQIRTSPPMPGSHWNTLRSRLHDGYILGTLESPLSPLTRKDDIRYKPTQRQIARARWDLVRSQVLAGRHLSPDSDQPTKPTLTETKPSTNSQAILRVNGLPGQERQARSNSNVEQPAQEVQGAPFLPTMQQSMELPRAGSEEKPVLKENNVGGCTDGIEHLQDLPDKMVNLGRRAKEIKPKFKRLIKLAQKEASASSSNLISTPTLQIPEIVPPVEGDQNDLPIFLWSTDLKPLYVSDIPSPVNSTQSNLKQGSSNPQKTGADLAKLINTTKSDELVLHTVTAEIDSNIRKHRKMSGRRALLYEMNRGRSQSDVWTLVLSMRIVSTDNDQMDMSLTKWSIFESADKILHAFVPLLYDAPVVHKYWGALYNLLVKVEMEVLLYVRERLSYIYDLVRTIQMGVRTDDGSKLPRYQIPRSLPIAFQDLVMLLVFISTTSRWNDFSWHQVQMSFEDCETHLIDGRKQLILMVHTDDYRESAGFQAVDSEALVSIMLANLISSPSTETDFYLTEIYSEYTTTVQRMVRDRASAKVYDDIKLLREELDAIRMTLKQQDEILHDFRSTMTITPGVFNLAVSVLDRSLDNVEQQSDDFDELINQTRTARTLAAQSISVKAESNSKAIIVFTVVTIVFLPLSFVTSYLGMNTSDLRNMKSSQRLFWAIGAPVTFFVLGSAMMAAFYGTFYQKFIKPMTKEKGD